ncbi:MAG: hypothetical protein ACI8ZB_002962 [Desulforhopalus sp.]|jgi:hypothetical protein
MKLTKFILVLFFMFWLVLPSMVVGKGYMGGNGTVAAEEPAADTDDGSGGLPDTVEGPLNDKMSDAGKLYGDLYTILRQEGGIWDQKLVPQVDTNGDPVLDSYGFQILEVVTGKTVGGEPVLTVIDPGATNNYSDYGYYAAEIYEDDSEIPTYVVAQSPYPAQCVQPVASYERWGDISSVTLLTKNRLPMTISYDPTWGRSECEVGQLEPGVDITADANGVLTIPVNQWFVEPCARDVDGNPIPAEICQWPLGDDVVTITYPDGVLWTALMGEVHFGRLNLSRAPEAVLQAAFDEAINNMNSDDTVAIEIDAAGRLLLTKNVYDELPDPATGLPVLLKDTDGNPVLAQKAIDSPLENVALYVKLMKDGHLVTPGDERMPIDRSKNGGIPLWKMLELTDGPGAKALRPTIDIAKLDSFRFGDLVDVAKEVEYLTYYDCVDSAGDETACLCKDDNPSQPELEYALATCDNVVDRKLSFFEGADLVKDIDCPVSSFRLETYDGSDEYFNEYTCEGPFVGITTNDGGTPDGVDLNFAASLLSAAGDKTGDISVDMVVYLNSILGINKVLGYSAYDAEGNPTDTAINYEENPEYFNFAPLSGYDRGTTFGNRGEGGDVTVLVGGDGSWKETPVGISDAMMGGYSIFGNIGLDPDKGFPNGSIQATSDIRGFTQQADDNLGVISFIHTYQIPELR